MLYYFLLLQLVFANLYINIQNSYCPYNDLYGQATICQDISTHQKNKFPILLGVGYDPLENNIKLPLVELNYNNNSIYPEEFQIKLINESLVSTKIYNNIDQYLLNQTIRGMPDNIIQFLLDKFEYGDNNIGTSHQFINLYDIELQMDKIKIIPEIQQIFSKLPIEYDPEIYQNIIKYFGTEIVIKGKAGAQIDKISISKKCFGSVNLIKQFELNFLKDLDPLKYQNIQYDGNFQLYAKFGSNGMYGGDPKILNWQDRIQTIKTYPVLQDFSTISIVDFVFRYILKSEPIIKNLQIAINKYKMDFIMSINKTITNWKMQPKMVFFVPTRLGQNSNRNNVPITRSNQGIAYKDYLNLTNSLPKYYSSTYCKRNKEGLLYADSNIHYSSSKNGSLIEGQGCSYIEYRVTSSKIINNKPYIFSYIYRDYCCMGCIPSVITPYVEKFPDGSVHSFPFEGEFVCNCPIF